MDFKDKKSDMKSSEDQLFQAINKNDMDSFNKLVLKEELDFNCVESKTKETPLHIAVEKKNLAMVVQLLKYGAKPYQPDITLVSPIKLALNQFSEEEKPSQSSVIFELLKHNNVWQIKDLRKIIDFCVIQYDSAAKETDNRALFDFGANYLTGININNLKFTQNKKNLIKLVAHNYGFSSSAIAHELCLLSAAEVKAEKISTIAKQKVKDDLTQKTLILYRDQSQWWACGYDNEQKIQIFLVENEYSLKDDMSEIPASIKFKLTKKIAWQLNYNSIKSQAVKKLADGGEIPLEGFFHENYLVLRICILLEMIVRLKCENIICPKDIFITNEISAEDNRQAIIEILEQEISDQLQTLQVNQLCEFIYNDLKNKPSHQLLLQEALAANLFKKIKSLGNLREFTFAGGWNVHAIYINFITKYLNHEVLQDNENDNKSIYIRIDNLGAGLNSQFGRNFGRLAGKLCHEIDAKRLKPNQQADTYRFPFLIGPILENEFDQAWLQQYLFELIKIYDFPTSKKPETTIYCCAEEKVPPKKIIFDTKALREEFFITSGKKQTAGNCVVKNSQSGFKIRLGLHHQFDQKNRQNFIEQRGKVYRWLKSEQAKIIAPYKQQQPLSADYLTGHWKAFCLPLHSLDNVKALVLKIRNFYKEVYEPPFPKIKKAKLAEPDFDVYVPFELCTYEYKDNDLKFSSADDEFEAGNLITIDKIYEAGQIKCITWLHGSAGVGKSTLCEYIAVKWAQNKLYAHFDVVFFLNLSKLSAMPEDFTCYDLIAQSLSNEIKPQQIQHLVNSKFKILWLLDGLDHVSRGSPLQNAVEKLIKNNYVLATSRFNKSNISQFSPKNTIKLNGFNANASKLKFITHYFSEKENLQAEKLSRLVLQDQSIAQLAENPLNLVFLCNVFADEDQGLSIPNHNLTLTELLIKIFTKKIILNHDLFNFIKFLAFLSWKDRKIINQSCIAEICEKISMNSEEKCRFSKEKIQFLLGDFSNLNIIQPLSQSKSEYYFSNYLFQDFFVAAYFVEILVSKKEHEYDSFIKKWLITSKYDSNFQPIVKFIAGLLSYENKILTHFNLNCDEQTITQAIITFWKILQDDSIYISYEKYLNLQFICYLEAGCDKRIPNYEFMNRASKNLILSNLPIDIPRTTIRFIATVLLPLAEKIKVHLIRTPEKEKKEEKKEFAKTKNSITKSIEEYESKLEIFFPASHSAIKLPAQPRNLISDLQKNLDVIEVSFAETINEKNIKYFIEAGEDIVNLLKNPSIQKELDEKLVVRAGKSLILYLQCGLCKTPPFINSDMILDAFDFFAEHKKPQLYQELKKIVLDAMTKQVLHFSYSPTRVIGNEFLLFIRKSLIEKYTENLKIVIPGGISNYFSDLTHLKQKKMDAVDRLYALVPFWINADNRQDILSSIVKVLESLSNFQDKSIRLLEFAQYIGQNFPALIASNGILMNRLNINLHAPLRDKSKNIQELTLLSLLQISSHIKLDLQDLGNLNYFLADKVWGSWVIEIYKKSKWPEVTSVIQRIFYDCHITASITDQMQYSYQEMLVKYAIPRRNGFEVLQLSLEKKPEMIDLIDIVELFDEAPHDQKLGKKDENKSLVADSIKFATKISPHIAQKLVDRLSKEIYKSITDRKVESCLKVLINMQPLHHTIVVPAWLANELVKKFEKEYSYHAIILAEKIAKKISGAMLTSLVNGLKGNYLQVYGSLQVLHKMNNENQITHVSDTLGENIVRIFSDDDHFNLAMTLAKSLIMFHGELSVAEFLGMIMLNYFSSNESIKQSIKTEEKIKTPIFNAIAIQLRKNILVISKAKPDALEFLDKNLKWKYRCLDFIENLEAEFFYHSESKYENLSHVHNILFQALIQVFKDENPINSSKAIALTYRLTMTNLKERLPILAENLEAQNSVVQNDILKILIRLGPQAGHPAIIKALLSIFSSQPDPKLLDQTLNVIIAIGKNASNLDIIKQLLSVKCYNNLAFHALNQLDIWYALKELTLFDSFMLHCSQLSFSLLTNVQQLLILHLVNSSEVLKHYESKDEKYSNEIKLVFNVVKNIFNQVYDEIIKQLKILTPKLKLCENSILDHKMQINENQINGSFLKFSPKKRSGREAVLESIQYLFEVANAHCNDFKIRKDSLQSVLNKNSRSIFYLVETLCQLFSDSCTIYKNDFILLIQENKEEKLKVEEEKKAKTFIASYEKIDEKERWVVNGYMTNNKNRCAIDISHESSYPPSLNMIFPYFGYMDREYFLSAFFRINQLISQSHGGQGILSKHLEKLYYDNLSSNLSLRLGALGLSLHLSLTWFRDKFVVINDIISSLEVEGTPSFAVVDVASKLLILLPQDSKLINKMLTNLLKPSVITVLLYSIPIKEKEDLLSSKNFSIKNMLALYFSFEILDEASARSQLELIVQTIMIQGCQMSYSSNTIYLIMPGNDIIHEISTISFDSVRIERLTSYFKSRIIDPSKKIFDTIFGKSDNERKEAIPQQLALSSSPSPAPHDSLPLMSRQIQSSSDAKQDFMQKLSNLCEDSGYTFSLKRPKNDIVIIQFTAIDNVFAVVEDIKKELIVLATLLRKTIETADIKAKQYQLKPDWKQWTLSITAESVTLDQIIKLLQKAGLSYFSSPAKFEATLFSNARYNREKLVGSSEALGEKIEIVTCAMQ